MWCVIWQNTQLLGVSPIYAKVIRKVKAKSNHIMKNLRIESHMIRFRVKLRAGVEKVRFLGFWLHAIKQLNRIKGSRSYGRPLFRWVIDLDGCRNITLLAKAGAPVALWRL